MYRPPHFREDRLEVLHDLIREHPLATLVASGPDGLFGNHLPFVLHADVGEYGTLRGHVARANPLWELFDPAIEVVLIFQGLDSYITPSWYPSKVVDGKVVPTWNYTAVHAVGPLRVIEDADWLRSHLDTLVSHQEKDRAQPWSVEDAPEDFIANKLTEIVGIEIPISRIEGKWKASQNQSPENRKGIIQGLKSEKSDETAAMSDLVTTRGDQS